MADSARTTRSTLRKLTTLRKRVQEARTMGLQIRPKDSLEYLLIDQGLELLAETMKASRALDDSRKDKR